MARIGPGSLIDEWDLPEGGDLVVPPFEDGRLKYDYLCCLCVVDSYLLPVENGEVPGVAHLARSSERVKCNVGHHVVSLRGLAELVPNSHSLGGVGYLPCCCLEDLGGWAVGDLEAVAVFSDVGRRASVDDVEGDGSVHHALSCLLVAHTVGLKDLAGVVPIVALRELGVAVPLVQGRVGAAEVTIPLVVGGYVDALDFGADIDDALVSDVRLRLLFCKQCFCGL